jgi:hypothetical protein
MMLLPNTVLRSQNLLPIVAFAVILLLVPAISTAQCPASTVTCEGTDYGEVVFYESETSTAPTHTISYSNCSASYDLVEGTLNAVVYVHEANEHWSRAIAVDRFELHNVPAAMLKIRLYHSMFWQADPSSRMAWAGGVSKLTVGCCSAQVGSYMSFIEPYVELEVAALEGVPFELTYETYAWGEGYYPISTMFCRLKFVDLPPGAEITSCNGYGDPSVPIEQSTWGRIKSLYR